MQHVPICWQLVFFITLCAIILILMIATLIINLLTVTVVSILHDPCCSVIFQTLLHSPHCPDHRDSPVLHILPLLCVALQVLWEVYGNCISSLTVDLCAAVFCPCGMVFLCALWPIWH